MQLKFKKTISLVLLASLTTASLSVIGCGSKKDEGVKAKGPVTAGNANQGGSGGSSAATTGAIDSKVVSIEIAAITESNSGNYSFDLKVNKSQSNQTVALNMVDIENIPYGTGYAVLDGLNTYWIAKCDSPICNILFLTAFATTTEGKKYVQVGAAKSKYQDTLLAIIGYPEKPDAVVDPKILSIEQMIEILKPKIDYDNMGF